VKTEQALINYALLTKVVSPFIQVAYLQVLENETANQCKICTQNFVYTRLVEERTRSAIHACNREYMGLEKDLKTLFDLIDWTCDASHEQ